MIKVYIADDHPSIIYGLQNMLAQEKEIQVAQSFHTGKDLLEGLAKSLPDVLILDIHLPDITGNQLARIISTQYPTVGILAFTNMNTDFHIQDMLSHGCLGYLLKTADISTVVTAIKEVYAGRKYLEYPLEAELKQDMVKAEKRLISAPALTKREKEIIKLICAGKSNQQVAEELFISLRTVENHRFNLQQKLKVKNTAELVKLALHAGWA